MGNVTRWEDTIAAVATAPGVAGVAVVRISGAESLQIAEKVFCPEVSTSLTARGPIRAERA